MRSIHYVNGAFVSEEDARISALDLSVLRGYGVFDYAPIYKGLPFHLTDHLKRLKGSVKQLGLSFSLSLTALEAISLSLIEKNAPIDAGLRFVVTGGISEGEQLFSKGGSSLIILFHPRNLQPKKYYLQGMRAITTDTQRFLPSVKTTHYMPAIFAREKARMAGFDDALYLNQKREILEGTTSNLFFLKENVLITAEKDIVKGVTRHVFLELAKEIFPIEFRSLSLEEVESCEEAFLTSSTKDAIPLVQIDEMKIGKGVPGQKTELLRRLFREYLHSYSLKKPLISSKTPSSF